MDTIKKTLAALVLTLIIFVVIFHAYGIVNASTPPEFAGFTTTPEPDDTDVPDPTEPPPPDPTEPPDPDPTEPSSDPTEIIIINPRVTNDPNETEAPNATESPQRTKTPAIIPRTTGTATVSRAIPSMCRPKVYYMVKFVCGFQGAQFSVLEPSVKAGNYATAINLHNYNEQPACGLKRPALDYSEFDTQLPPAFAQEQFEIAPLSVLVVDCNSIWASTGIAHGTFLKGMIEIGLGENLPAVAVYTAQITDQMKMTETGAGISIDVEYLTPFEK